MMMFVMDTFKEKHLSGDYCTGTVTSHGDHTVSQHSVKATLLPHSAVWLDKPFSSRLNFTVAILILVLKPLSFCPYLSLLTEACQVNHNPVCSGIFSPVCIFLAFFCVLSGCPLFYVSLVFCSSVLSSSLTYSIHFSLCPFPLYLFCLSHLLTPGFWAVFIPGSNLTLFHFYSFFFYTRNYF